MKLSVIIVNWNTRDLTLQSLRTLYEHAPACEFEVLLIDNDSSDDSVEHIKKEFPQVMLVENDDNLGFGKANNQGMRMAKGEYIFLLNSDVIVLEGGVQKLVDYLDTHPDATMVGPRLLNEDRTFQLACRRSLPNPLNSFLYLFGISKIIKSKKIASYKKEYDDPTVTEPVEGISGAAMMFRRVVFEKTGGFDETFFMYGEDLDLCKQVQDNGWKTVYVADAQIVHLGGGSSAKRRTQSLINFYESMWIYYKKHYGQQHNRFLQMGIWCGIQAKKYIALLRNMIKKRA